MLKLSLNLYIYIKKNQILIYINKKLFFRQSFLYKSNLIHNLTFSKIQFNFFYILHVLSYFGFIPSLKKKEN